MAMFAGLFAMFGIFFIVVGLAILIFYLIGLWKLFQKAGRNGWEAIVPFYNTWVLTEIAGLAWWYALIIIFSDIFGGTNAEDSLGFILSVCSIVAKFFIFYNISKKLHKDTGFAILMTIFPVIMVPLVGFSSSYQFDNKVVVSENGPIGPNVNDYSHDTKHTNSESNSGAHPYSNHFCPHCGKSVEAEAKFCGNCGNMIK